MQSKCSSEFVGGTKRDWYPSEFIAKSLVRNTLAHQKCASSEFLQGPSEESSEFVPNPSAVEG